MQFYKLQVPQIWIMCSEICITHSAQFATRLLMTDFVLSCPHIGRYSWWRFIIFYAKYLLYDLQNTLIMILIPNNMIHAQAYTIVPYNMPVS